MRCQVTLCWIFVSAIQPGQEQMTFAERLEALSLAGSKNR